MTTVEEAFLDSIRGRIIMDDSDRLLKYTNVYSEFDGCNFYCFHVHLQNGTDAGMEWYKFDMLRNFNVLESYEITNPDGSLTVRKEWVRSLSYPI